MWATVIAVVGTLAGGVLAGVVQARTARAGRAESRRDAWLADAVAAVTALVVALADHRRAMWVLGDLRLSGADKAAVAQARSVTHETRSAVTAPLVTVSILAPMLARSAQRAVKAAYAMRNAPDSSVLEVLRAGALETSDHFVDEAGAVFTHHLCVLPSKTNTPSKS
jgi:hypothetical protein